MFDSTPQNPYSAQKQSCKLRASKYMENLAHDFTAVITPGFYIYQIRDIIFSVNLSGLKYFKSQISKK